MSNGYVMSVLYHPGKANAVLDGLCRINMGSVSNLEKAKKDLLKDVHRLAHFGVRLEDSPMLLLGFILYVNHLWRLT